MSSLIYGISDPICTSRPPDFLANGTQPNARWRIESFEVTWRSKLTDGCEGWWRFAGVRLPLDAVASQDAPLSLQTAQISTDTERLGCF